MGLSARVHTMPVFDAQEQTNEQAIEDNCRRGKILPLDCQRFEKLAVFVDTQRCSSIRKCNSGIWRSTDVKIAANAQRLHNNLIATDQLLRQLARLPIFPFFTIGL